MIVQINCKAIDNAIKDMNLFPTTKEVITAYQEEVSKLDKQDQELLRKLEALQTQLTSNLMEKELTDDISLLFNLSLQGKQINIEADVVNTMLEQLGEKKLEVKVKYVPIFKEGLKKDYPKVLKYNANELVNDLIYAMLKAIADLSNEMDKQYEEISQSIYEVFETPEIMESYPSLKYDFYREKYRPVYEEPFPTVISKQDVFNSVAGILNFPNPEDKNSEK